MADWSIFVQVALSSFHVSSYAVFRARAGANLRRPACKVTVTADDAGKRSLSQHSNGVAIEGLTVVRQPIPEGEGAE